MLPIYICEDDNTQLLYFKNLIDKTILIDELDAAVVCACSSPTQLLSHLSIHQSPALYFLDVELNSNMDGFALALEIRKYDPRGFIVFVTTHSELSFLSFEYKVEAMDYIIKDNMSVIPNRISECLSKALNLYTLPTNTVQKAIALKIDGHIVSLKLPDIYSIETSTESHKIRIYRKNGYSEFFYSLKKITKLLDDSFFQCHKSCLINLTHIKDIDKKHCQAILDNGKVCPVATRQMQALIGLVHM